MNQENKRNVIILILISVVFAAVFIMLLVRQAHKKDETEPVTSTQLTLNDLTSDEVMEDLALYQDTMSEADEIESVSDEPIIVNNMGFFSNTKFSTFQAMSFPLYTDSYFRFYAGETHPQFFITINENSYKSTDAYLTFNFTVDGLSDYTFRCTAYPGDDMLIISCKEYEEAHSMQLPLTDD